MNFIKVLVLNRIIIFIYILYKSNILFIYLKNNIFYFCFFLKKHNNLRERINKFKRKYYHIKKKKKCLMEKIINQI
jgi:hypothetical protein